MAILPEASRLWSFCFWLFCSSQDPIAIARKGVDPTWMKGVDWRHPRWMDSECRGWATTAKKRRWPPSPCGLSPEQEKAIAFDEVVQSITGEARAAKALDLLARLEIRSLAELIQQIHSPAWETRSERLPHKLAVCLSRFVHELDQKAAPLVDDPPIEQPAHEEMSEAVPLPEHRGPMPCT